MILRQPAPGKEMTLIEHLHRRFYNLKYYLYYKYDIFIGYIDKNNKPLKCRRCNSYNMVHGKEFFDNGLLCEYEVKCNKCNTINGYWAYGSWMN